MITAKPNPSWDDPAGSNFIPRKRQHAPAVYELAVRQSNSGFFNYLGKFTLLCVVGLAIYFAARWATHGRFLTAAEANDTADSAVPTPVVAQDAAPQGPALGYVASWGISTSSASVSWSTTVPATTALAYGTTRSLGETVAGEKKLDMTHGIKLTGLKPGTTYFYAAQSADKDGLVGNSALSSFTTLPVANGPAISHILVVPAKNNQVHISWHTSVPAFSFVQFGPTTTYNRWSTRTPLTTTAQPAFSWVPSGTIHYQLVSTNAQGIRTESPDYTFVEP